MSVVVTGASSGIGKACVAAFKATGEHVYGVDIEVDSTADEHIALDLSKETCGEELAAALEGRAVNVLVNNAAFADYSPALETGLPDWDKTIHVNLRAPFLLSKALHPALEATRGSVVNVSSVHALATSPGVAAYAASKGGLVSLSRALALEWAPRVRVNCVLPGAVDTRLLSAGLFRSGTTVGELGARHPLQRIGTPNEIAEAVVFLSQSDYITGAALTVDGGATARLSTE